ncbi:MAG: chromosome partitioning protein [Acidimicrobiales bacterium]
MAYVAFASAKASPGVTTTVTALAATWPRDRDLVVAELDPAGGDLGVRFDLATEPGLVTLAAAGRRELDRSTFVGHTQRLPFADRSGADGDSEGAVRRVLVGPVAADQAGAALAALRGGLPGVLSSLSADVLVDCGRLDPSSAVHDVVTEADLLVVVTRPVVAEVHHLAARLSALRPKALSLLLVGDRPYSVAEVADAVGASPLGTLPFDDRAAAALTVGHTNGARILRRSRLLRDARALAEGLAGWLPPGPVRPARSVPPPPLDAPAQPPQNGHPDAGRARQGPTPSPPAPGPLRAAVSNGPRHFRRERDEERR